MRSKNDKQTIGIVGKKYINLGWSIIPVEPKGKKPLIEWKEFQTRRASEVELRSWLQKWPEMNLGIVTGNISNLVVVDLDGTMGLMSGINLKLVSHVQSITGNGKQVFYKWKDGIKNSAQVNSSRRRRKRRRRLHCSTAQHPPFWTDVPMGTICPGPYTRLPDGTLSCDIHGVIPGLYCEDR